MIRYAEMEKSEKNKISHRYRAIEKLLQHFSGNEKTEEPEKKEESEKKVEPEKEEEHEEKNNQEKNENKEKKIETEK